MKRFRMFLAKSILFYVLAMATQHVTAQTDTTFTYQGRLEQMGQPVSGVVDLDFALFDAPVGGNQIDAELVLDSVPVTDGIFTVELDFGALAFDNGNRWLQIEVNTSTLSPRQPINRSPYAIQTRGIFVDEQENVGIGTTTPGIAAPGSKLDVFGGPMLVSNTGNQADLLWLASDRSWVFRQEGTGAGAALKLQSVGGGGNKNFIVQTDGGVGIGTTSPLAKLDVRGDVRLGASGQFRAAAGEESLRIIRGTMDLGGNIQQGQGFTSTRLGFGDYLITFDTPFTGVPSVTATADDFEENLTLFHYYVAGVFAPSTTSVRIRVRGNSSSALPTGRIDQPFHFIAVGPR